MTDKIKIAVFAEGYFENILEFEDGKEAEAFDRGATYGADKYGGSIQCVQLPLADWADEEYGYMKGWKEFKEEHGKSV